MYFCEKIESSFLKKNFFLSGFYFVSPANKILAETTNEKLLKSRADKSFCVRCVIKIVTIFQSARAQIAFNSFVGKPRNIRKSQIKIFIFSFVGFSRNFICVFFGIFSFKHNLCFYQSSPYHKIGKIKLRLKLSYRKDK